LGQKRGVISKSNNDKNVNPKVTSAGYIQPSYKKGPQKMDIGPLRCMGPGLYDWTDDGEFTIWLANHPTSDHEVSINCITEFFIDESNEASIDLARVLLIIELTWSEEEESKYCGGKATAVDAQRCLEDKLEFCS